MIDVDKFFYTTVDPETGFPAMTTLLHRVCGGDGAKFDEACRLINLFMQEAARGQS